MCVCVCVSVCTMGCWIDAGCGRELVGRQSASASARHDWVVSLCVRFLADADGTAGMAWQHAAVNLSIYWKADQVIARNRRRKIQNSQDLRNKMVPKSLLSIF